MKGNAFMLISKELQDGFNAQIGHEFAASEAENLELLSDLFFDQAAEETEHGMKFVNYILDTSGELNIPVIPQAKFDFTSAKEAVQAALDWEIRVTGQINALMDLAKEQNDHLAQYFLQWFIDEQLEEITKMEQLLSVIQRAGEKNLLMVEAYLVHLDKGD
jgi:ferritin